MTQAPNAAQDGDDTTEQLREDGVLSNANTARLAAVATGADTATKVATAAINLVIGIAIGLLVSGVATSAVRVGREKRPSAG